MGDSPQNQPVNTKLTILLPNRLILRRPRRAHARSRRRPISKPNSMVIPQARRRRNRRPRQRVAPRPIGIKTGKPSRRPGGGEFPALPGGTASQSLVEALGLVFGSLGVVFHRRFEESEVVIWLRTLLNRLIFLLVLARFSPPPSRHFFKLPKQDFSFSFSSSKNLL
ncbi:hypothetical protein TorRG33x02_222150 [Trema orientale]|uniref:Uncharacterized protein n=1 Tax=Trema orientale TaxID=63057 RepID=A0A2P5E8X5_TREOI|nr:hypothetical protein TorRG33x02_222150 [Trema orientale]